MERVYELSSLIHGKFRSESEFARKINWSKQRVNKIVNGKMQPSLDDAIEIANALDEPLEKIAQIFLRQKSPNGDLQEAQ